MHEFKLEEVEKWALGVDLVPPTCVSGDLNKLQRSSVPLKLSLMLMG